MAEFMKTLLLLSVSGSVLGLLLILARRVGGKRLPSALWYYAWLPVLLRLVLPLPGLLPGAQASSETTPAAVLMQADAPAAEAATHTETVSQVETTEPTQPHIQPIAVLKKSELWLAVWLIGAVFRFTRYTAGYIRFRCVLMRTLHMTDEKTTRAYKELNGLNDPGLFASAYVPTPMLVGLFRPLIVLPQGVFSEESTRNVLRHELTHYHRGDLYVKWFFVCVSSLHWFNPLMPLFRRELDRVCELSCDENVLVRMEPSERQSYGETLLDFASNRTLPAGVVATTFASEKHALKERLEQIMKFKYKPRTIIALTIAALLLMSVVALAAAPARVSAASADSPEPTPPPNASASGSNKTDYGTSSDVDDFPINAVSDTSHDTDPDENALSNDDPASMKQEHFDFDHNAIETVPDGSCESQKTGTRTVQVGTRTVVDSEAWDEYTIICLGCGKIYSSLEEFGEYDSCDSGYLDYDIYTHHDAVTHEEPVNATPHVHTWVTETVPDGHYEYQKTGTREVQIGTRTVVDSEAWDEWEISCLGCGKIYSSPEEFDEYDSCDSGYIVYDIYYHHDAVTHEEPVYETQDIYEDVWIDTSYTIERCTGCNVTR